MVVVVLGGVGLGSFVRVCYGVGATGHRLATGRQGVFEVVEAHMFLRMCMLCYHLHYAVLCWAVPCRYRALRKDITQTELPLLVSIA